MTYTEKPQPSPSDHVDAAAPGPLSGIIIGLDIGGTKTRGVRFEDGRAVADESAGSSNVQNVSPEDAAFNLAELFARIGGGKVAQVYAGAGGIDTHDDAAALAALKKQGLQVAKMDPAETARWKQIGAKVAADMQKEGKISAPIVAAIRKSNGTR